MSFDWSQESKERYFKKAEVAVKAAGVDDFLQIDKRAFGVTKENKVKVYLKPILRKGNTRRWQKAKKKIKDAYEVPAGRDEYGRQIKNLFIHGYIVLEMEEQDR